MAVDASVFFFGGFLSNPFVLLMSGAQSDCFQVLYELVQLTLLLDKVHLLLDLSSVSSRHWQGWMQLIVARALAMGRAAFPLFTISPESSPEELTSFIASYDIAKKHITDRAEMVQRQTLATNVVANTCESSTLRSFKGRKDDSDSYTTPDGERPSLFARHIRMSTEDSASLGLHSRQHSFVSYSTPRLNQTEAKPAAILPDSGSKRFVVFVAGLHRASPVVQGCLLRILDRCQVVSDGVPVCLTGNLTVIATLEEHAAGSLDHALRERFILSYALPCDAFQRTTEIALATLPALWESQASLNEVVKRVETVTINFAVESYLQRAFAAVRQNVAIGFQLPQWQTSRHLILVAKAYAVLQGRDYVTPQDIVVTIEYVLPHRISLSPGVMINEEPWGLLVNFSDPCSTGALVQDSATKSLLAQTAQLVRSIVATVLAPL